MNVQFWMSVLHWARWIGAFAIGAPLVVGGIGMLLFGRDADDVRRLRPAQRASRHAARVDERFEIRLNEPVE